MSGVKMLGGNEPSCIVDVEGTRMQEKPGARVPEESKQARWPEEREGIRESLV